MTFYRFDGLKGRLRLLGCFVGAAFAGALAAAPQIPAVNAQTLGIAAIVNDQVISAYDLQQRIGLVVSSAGVQPTQENIQRIQEQVLRSLIDEQLQMEEAQRLEVEVEPREVDAAIARIAAQNNMTADQIEATLARAGIDVQTLRRQITAEIAWSKVVRQRFAPRVSVGEEDIDQVYERMLSDAERTKYLVSEIFIGVDSPEQEETMRIGAQRLAEQIRQQGVPFNAVAAQLSQAPSAASGGDLGWVQEGQLPEQLSEALRGMQPGQISDPIRGVGGYYILQLRNKAAGASGDAAQVQFTLRQVSITSGEGSGDAMGQAEDLAEEAANCTDLQRLARDIDGASVSDIGPVAAGQLAPAIRSKVMPLQTGEMIAPEATGSGAQLIMVCRREQTYANLPSRDEIEERLFNQELSMIARRHLRDLRRDATVEFR